MGAPTQSHGNGGDPTPTKLSLIKDDRAKVKALWSLVYQLVQLLRSCSGEDDSIEPSLADLQAQITKEAPAKTKIRQIRQSRALDPGKNLQKQLYYNMNLPELVDMVSVIPELWFLRAFPASEVASLTMKLKAISVYLEDKGSFTQVSFKYKAAGVLQSAILLETLDNRGDLLAGFSPQDLQVISGLASDCARVARMETNDEKGGWPSRRRLHGDLPGTSWKKYVRKREKKKAPSLDFSQETPLVTDVGPSSSDDIQDAEEEAVGPSSLENIKTGTLKDEHAEAEVAHALGGDDNHDDAGGSGGLDNADKNAEALAASSNEEVKDAESSAGQLSHRIDAYRMLGCDF